MSGLCSIWTERTSSREAHSAPEGTVVALVGRENSNMAGRANYTAEAEQLFIRFAKRYQFSYRVMDAPIEICWEFPEQRLLSLPITLALQNLDELNFGVDNFWSYFFPYPKVCSTFEAILDAWVEGRARIIFGGFWEGHRLQVRTGGNWTTEYVAHTLIGRQNRGLVLQNKTGSAPL
jgi:hypothetical protein